MNFFFVENLYVLFIISSVNFNGNYLPRISVKKFSFCINTEQLKEFFAMFKKNIQIHQKELAK